MNESLGIPFFALATFGLQWKHKCFFWSSVPLHQTAKLFSLSCRVDTFDGPKLFHQTNCLADEKEDEKNMAAISN